MNRCMGFFFLLPRGVCLQLQSLEEAKNPAGNVLHLIQTCLGTTSLKKIRPVGQTISLRARIVSFSFRNSFSLVSNALKLVTQRRCGEMADATDLKSVGLKRPVPVRVRPSAPLKCGITKENRSKLWLNRLRTIPKQNASKRSLFDKHSTSDRLSSVHSKRNCSPVIASANCN